MIYTIAIDPGKNHCGLAIFSPEKRLIYLDVVRTEARPRITDPEWRQGAIEAHDGIQPIQVAHEVRRVVLTLGLVNTYINFVSEWPKHYSDDPGYDRKTSGKGVKAKDLFWLAACAGACAAVVNPVSVRYFLPSEWKSTAPDEVLWARIEKLFDKNLDEHAIVEVLKKRHGKNAHHALEAGGIGLYALWRAGRGMTAAKET